MRTTGIAYVCLLAYPVIMLLVPDPNSIRWGWKTGGLEPLPPEIKERCGRNQWNLLIFKFFVLVVVCFFLIRQSSIPLHDVGIRRTQPVNLVILGLVTASLLILWACGLRSLTAKVASLKYGPPYLLRESIPKLICLIVLGAFAEEFWRALSLIAFTKAGVSVFFAVIATSIVFGIGHVFSWKSVGGALGRMLGPCIAGIFCASLFLWFHSLFVPMSAHVLLNAFGTLTGRKRLIAKEESNLLV